jgi:hypothetical protein
MPDPELIELGVDLTPQLREIRLYPELFWPFISTKRLSPFVSGLWSPTALL